MHVFVQTVTKVSPLLSGLNRKEGMKATFQGRRAPAVLNV